MVPLAVLLLALTAVGLTSCSSDEQRSNGSVSATVPERLPAQLSPGSSVVRGTSTTLPPVTFVGDPSALEVFVSIDDLVPASDHERACAAQRLAGDAELFGRVRSELVPGSADFDRLSTFVTDCRRTVTNARSNAESVNAARGGSLSSEQVDCLTREYGSLAVSDVDALLASGIDPAGDLAKRGAEVNQRLLRNCGLDG